MLIASKKYKAIPQSDLCRNFVYYLSSAGDSNISFWSSKFCTPLMCVCVCVCAYFLCFCVFVFRCVVDVCFENISASCFSRSPYPNYFLSSYPQICFRLFYVHTEHFQIQEHLDTSVWCTFSASVPSCSWYHFFVLLISLPIVSLCHEWFYNATLQSDFSNRTL